MACRQRSWSKKCRCGVVTTIVALALFAGHTGPTVKRVFAADVPTAPAADEDVLVDRPLAVWRFEESAGSKRATAKRFAAEPLAAEMSGTVVFGEEGPRPPRHPNSQKENTAALFGAGRSILKISGSAAGFAEFQFTNGDSVTLEAWVNPFELTEGQQVYIVGKGRTSNPKFPADNQNWALRLSAAGGLARPSRSRPAARCAPCWSTWWRRTCTTCTSSTRTRLAAPSR